MAKFSILPHDMTLYSPQEPKGRKFIGGDQWPGDAWSDQPYGKDAGTATVAQAAKDLDAAQAHAESMGQTIEGLNHDLAQVQGELAALKAATDQITQDRAAAEAKRDEALQAVREAAEARDQAQADASGLRGRIERMEEAATAAAATIERLTGELAAANQKAADAESLNGRVQELETDLANAKAKIAPLDGDGDGKPGGSKKTA